MRKLKELILKKKNICLLIIICILLILVTDYLCGIILENYNDYVYTISFWPFAIIILLIPILIFIIPSDFNSLETKDNEIEFEYLQTGYDEYLTKILSSIEFKSIFINGPFGCGKSTLLNRVLKNMDIQTNEYMEIKLYGVKVEDNLDYLYYQMRGRESQQLQILKNTITHTLTSFLTLCAILISAIYSSTINESVFFYIGLMYIVLSAYIQYTKTVYYKEKYIIRKLDQIEFMIIDDLDRAYTDEGSIVSFIHTVYNFVNKSKGTKLILVGYRYSFLEERKTDKFTKVHILEKYYDFDFEFPIDIVRNQYIDLIKRELPDVKYNIEQIEYITELYKNCSTRELLKIRKHIKFMMKEDPIIIKKLYLSDYLFIAMLYVKNQINVDLFLSQINKDIRSWRFKRDFNDVKTLFDEVITEYSFSDDEKTYLNKVLEYCFKDVGSGLSRLGAFNYDNRLFNIPKYYKRSTYVMEAKSPEERIEGLTEKLNCCPEEIESMDIYFFYTSSIDKSKKEDVMSKIIQLCETESSYSCKLSNSVKYVIHNEDNRVGLNLKYNWLCADALSNKNVYESMCDLIDKNNFRNLSLYNQANLLERAFFNNDNTYSNLLDSEEKIELIKIFIELKRPYNILKIFEEKIEGLNKEMIEILLSQYKNYLNNIKENYNYYAEDPYKGKRKDEGDKDLMEYNEFKETATRIYKVDIEKYQFSFDEA